MHILLLYVLLPLRFSGCARAVKGKLAANPRLSSLLFSIRAPLEIDQHLSRATVIYLRTPLAPPFFGCAFFFLCSSRLGRELDDGEELAAAAVFAAGAEAEEAAAPVAAHQRLQAQAGMRQQRQSALIAWAAAASVEPFALVGFLGDTAANTFLKTCPMKANKQQINNQHVPQLGQEATAYADFRQPCRLRLQRPGCVQHGSASRRECAAVLAPDHSSDASRLLGLDLLGGVPAAKRRRLGTRWFV